MDICVKKNKISSGYSVKQTSVYMFFMNGTYSWTGLKMLDINSLCL